MTHCVSLFTLTTRKTSLMAQMVKRLPAMREIWVRSLGGEDPLEKEMATHSSILAWKITWTEEPGKLQSVGSWTRLRDSTFTFTRKISDIVFNCIDICTY